ncbi:MAG: MFS transporter [Ruminococcaceae bacterium]|nr:MFS transporter [Oscillospiraceae bacterium]
MKFLMLFFMCLYIYLTNGFAVTAFNVLLQTITTDLGWTATDRAFVSSAFPTGMVWFMLIGGIMADRFNLKRLMGGLLILLGAVMILRGVVTGVWPYYFVMFGFGILMALSLPIANKVIPMWFGGGKYFAVAAGFISSSNPLGQITANLFIVPILGFLGGSWQLLFILQGILVLVLALFFFIFAKNRTNLEAEFGSELITTKEDIGLWKNIKEIAKVPQAWLFMIGNFFTLGIVFGGSTQFYTVVQVVPEWSLTMADAGYITSFNNFSSMIMYTVAPLLIGRFLAKSYERNYRWIAIIAGVLCAILFPIGIGSYNMTVICVVYFITGLLFGPFIPAPKILLMKLKQISGPRAGTAVGMYFTLERIGQTVIGTIIAMSMVGENTDPVGTLQIVYLFYLVSPITMTIAYFLEKRDKKKEAAQAAPAAAE